MSGYTIIGRKPVDGDIRPEEWGDPGSEGIGGGPSGCVWPGGWRSIMLAGTLGLSACGLTAQQIQTDITTGIAAACADAAKTAQEFPTSPVAPWANAACPGGMAAATLVQNSDTLQWVGQVIGQIKASGAPAPAAPAAAVPKA